MELGLAIIRIAGWLIGAGVLLLVVGLVLSLKPVVGPMDDGTPPQKPDLGAALIELIRESHKIVLDDAASPQKKFAAAGMLLVYLGLALLVVGVIPVVATWIQEAVGGAPDPTPTESDTATPAPTSS